jgi:hypothetical protein
MTAVFFFEGETGGLMFVGQRYSQSRQRSSRFAREDTAADYPCSQRGKKRPKLYLLHRGVLRSPTPLPAPVSLTKKSLERDFVGASLLRSFQP